MSSHALTGTTRRSVPVVTGILMAIIASAFVAGPVAASYLWTETGRVGPYELTDSMSESSVRCNYLTVAVVDYSGPEHVWRGKLDRLEIRPPKVWSVRDSQTVGWRFLVQRAKNPTSTFNDPWVTTYRSAIQTATANEMSAAAFTPMIIPVDVPRGTLERNHGYRVMIKMLWYRADGTVQGSSKHLLSYYETYFKEHVESVAPPWCDARISYWQPD